MGLNIKTTNLPSFIRSSLNGVRPVQLTFNDVKNTNISSTSSFKYDPCRSPLKSSQQLNVDWSAFENHTFFMSAEAKINLAFDQIINGYPFDGSKIEVERFFENLSGFENWLFEQFPKNRGQLHFSSSYIAVKDHAGSLFSDISKNPTGGSILTPNSGTSMTIELQLFVPEETNDRQVIFQKLGSETLGFAMHLEPTGSTSFVEIQFMFVSGSTVLTTSNVISKGEMVHIGAALNREQTPHRLEFYKEAALVSTSRKSAIINDLPIDSTDFLIGSGSSITLGPTTLVPGSILSGTIDELRVWHSLRTINQLKEYSRKSVFTDEDLKLYYRFNEPAPPLVSDDTSTLNGIVLDSSGNSLHSIIVNFTGSLRKIADDDLTNRMIYEKDITAPVLFTGNLDVINLNAQLLASASLYDQKNPNLITKLIPQHYLQDGQFLEGLQTSNGNISNTYESTLPGTGQLASSQLMSSFLYIYARFFDEIKIFIDSYKNMRHVDYESTETVPDNFLLELVDQFGFNLPPLFNDASIDQYINAENIDRDISNSDYSLKTIQNELLKRTLINLPDVLRSKGTQHGIKSFLRSVGIDPDNTIKMREFGGPTSRNLSFSREHKRETGTMVLFETGSLIVSPFLSSSRVEVGFPEESGNFVNTSLFSPHGISNNSNDGLLTSGSWSIEGIVKWRPIDKSAMTSATQSLGRINVTGSNDSNGGLVANLLAISSSIDPRLVLYVRSGISASAPLLRTELELNTQNNLFDGNRWNISFGCQRNDDGLNSVVSSSYFIRAASQNNGEIDNYYSTSSFFLETKDSLDKNVFRTLHSVFNNSGSYLTIGENQVIISGSSTGVTAHRFLNDINVEPEARITAFTGLMSNLRFWSKALTHNEWKEHVKNFKSRGVNDPLTNFNFITDKSGSFERLRLESLIKQDSRESILGNMTFIDFSQNNNHLTGTGFSTDQALISELFDYSFLSPAFDEASSDEKIRIRSFFDNELVEQTPWATTAPVHEIIKSEDPTDDVRFSIEFSLIEVLNRDIVTMFSSFDSIDNAIGSPELLFSNDYPDLERLRYIYFNRIQEKLNFKNFFEFFRWFDMTIGTFIEQLVPRKTIFKGVNFTIESHMLERHKMSYQHEEIYLAESDRNRIRDVLLLQLISGEFRKF